MQAHNFLVLHILFSCFTHLQFILFLYSQQLTGIKYKCKKNSQSSQKIKVVKDNPDKTKVLLFNGETAWEKNWSEAD